MLPHASVAQWILGVFLILSAAGVILLRKPIHASLSFLFSLLLLAAFYLQLSAEFIAIMQILVYAGAILVIFVFVIVLFQDAHQQIMRLQSKSHPPLLLLASIALIVALGFLGSQFIELNYPPIHLPEDFGKARGIGQDLYLKFFFPFEAVILLFLVAVIGALYIAKKER